MNGGASEVRAAGGTLAGRRVLVTRPAAQAGRLGRLLEEHGAEVVTLPAIVLQPPGDWGPLDDALGRVRDFRWVIFTSANGVTAVLDRLAWAGRGPEALAGIALAAIGPETAAALARHGLQPEIVPGEYRAEGLAAALAPRVSPGDEILLARAEEARDVLPQALRGRGAHVTVAPAYRTVVAHEGADVVQRLLEARRLDTITFTSSSTVRGLVSLLGAGNARRLLGGVVLAAIGPVTAGTLEEYGLRADVVAAEYTVPALAEAIVAHFAAPPATR